MWAQILCNRLTKEIEERNLLPETQAGFRIGRCTIDNIYILNALAQKSINKRGKLYTLFIDLKAAFDTINREQLWKIMERLKISRYLINCIKEIYRVTPLTVGTTTFFTSKGLKQGCPLSPILFALYIYDLDDVLRSAQSGGSVIGRRKVFSLVYADDVAVLAEDERDMKEMLNTL